MPSTEFKPSLTVLDVGHGNAAVLKDDTNRVLIFDAGNGQHLLRYLRKNEIKEVEALFLSHADLDHMGGATSLLLDKVLKIHRLFLNADPTKKTVAFRQLQYAIKEADLERKTITETQLTTSLTGRFDAGKTKIEILYPPPYNTITGVSGSSSLGRKQTSNSLSAAIRIIFDDSPKVLLGGDIEFECLDEWKNRNTDSKAATLVFPHHGGLPGGSQSSDMEIFSYELGKIVNPKLIIFSIHKTKYNLPRPEVINALSKALPSVKFVCTQLPTSIEKTVLTEVSGHWDLHRSKSEESISCNQGSVRIMLDDDSKISFVK